MSCAGWSQPSAAIWHTSMSRDRQHPAGGGKRMLGRSAGKHTAQADKTGTTNKYHQPLRGFHFIQTTLDAHSRLVYLELMADERKQTAADFWLRTKARFARQGIIVGKC